MAKISKNAIKEMIDGSFGVILEDRAADAIAEILQAKAMEIANFAVCAASKKNRTTILKEDVEAYTFKSGEIDA